MQSKGDGLHLNYDERKQLFRILWDETTDDYLKALLFFDDHFEQYGVEDGADIRKITDAFYAYNGIRVFRLLGSDRVKQYGLENDLSVITAVRDATPCTNPRRLFVHHCHDGNIMNTSICRQGQSKS